MDPRVAKLVMLKKIIQKSPEWFQARSKMITASSASNLLIKDDKTCDPYIKEYDLRGIFEKNSRCCNPYGSKNQYILDKCVGSKFKGSVATYWGQKYEDVVCDIYRNRFKTEILEFGIITHPKYSWLGASPDGITPSGTMIEIKCPFRRKITGIPPFYYWIQVQLQLEVCDLEVCDFVEYGFMEFLSDEEFRDDQSLDKTVYNKGAVVCIQLLDDNSEPILGECSYCYPPKEILDDTEKIISWSHLKIDELKKMLKEGAEHKVNINLTYWKVVDFSIVKIKRDRKWFEDVRPVFEKGWGEIEYYKRNENYMHLVTKKKMSDIDGKTLHLDVENSCILHSDSE